MKHSKWKVPSNQVAPVFNKKNLHCACKTQIKKYIPTYMSGAVTCLFCSSSAQANVSHKGTFPLNNLNIKFAFMNSSWLVTKEFLILFLRFWAVFCFHYLSLLDLFFPLFPLAPTVLSQSPHWHPGPTHQTCVVLTLITVRAKQNFWSQYQRLRKPWDLVQLHDLLCLAISVS